MKEAVIGSFVLAVLANSEIVSLILLLCWCGWLFSTMYKADAERRN